MVESTLRRMMSSASVKTADYNFEVDGGRIDPRDVGIPDSLDMCAKVINQLQNYLVDVQAERAKLDIEVESAEEQLRKIRIHMSRQMLQLGIRAPMAAEAIDPIDSTAEEIEPTEPPDLPKLNADGGFDP